MKQSEIIKRIAKAWDKQRELKRKENFAVYRIDSPHVSKDFGLRLPISSTYQIVKPFKF